MLYCTPFCLFFPHDACRLHACMRCWATGIILNMRSLLALSLYHAGVHSSLFLRYLLIVLLPFFALPSLFLHLPHTLPFQVMEWAFIEH